MFENTLIELPFSESFKKKQADTSFEAEGNAPNGVNTCQNGDDICEGDQDVIPLEDDEDFPSYVSFLN